MSEVAQPMTDSIPTPAVEPPPMHAEVVRETDKVRAKKFQRIVAAAKRVQTLPNGERRFVRFNQLEILEHWILLINFAILATTGLLEMFSNNRISADFITPVFRNLDNLRGLHNVAAVFYVGMMLIHVLLIVIRWFIKNEPPVLIPSRLDWADFIKTWKYLLSRSFPRPEFGRFTIDQKVTYWMVACFSVLMLLTSLAQWFQTWVSQYLTEAILPISRSLHSLTGLLIVVTFLPWHIYHTVIKERNASIFSGVLDEKTISHNHPLEYRQILAALSEYQVLTGKTPAGEPQAPKSEEAQPVLTDLTAPAVPPAVDQTAETLDQKQSADS